MMNSSPTFSPLLPHTDSLLLPHTDSLLSPSAGRLLLPPAGRFLLQQYCIALSLCGHILHLLFNNSELREDSFLSDFPSLPVFYKPDTMCPIETSLFLTTGSIQLERQRDDLKAQLERYGSDLTPCKTECLKTYWWLLRFCYDLLQLLLTAEQTIFDVLGVLPELPLLSLKNRSADQVRRDLMEIKTSLEHYKKCVESDDPAELVTRIPEYSVDAPVMFSELQQLISNK